MGRNGEGGEDIPKNEKNIYVKAQEKKQKSCLGLRGNSGDYGRLRRVE